jgi:hypothetical protein
MFRILVKITATILLVPISALPNRNSLPPNRCGWTDPCGHFSFKLFQVRHNPNFIDWFFRCLKTTIRFSDRTCALVIQKVITDHNLLARCGEGEIMTREARMISGIILLTVATIQYGGYFPLTSLMNQGSGYTENPLRQNFFRAGHAHAGVIVILSLVCQVLADGAVLPDPLLWLVRVGVPLAAILISSGFFFSVLPPTAAQASGAVAMIYLGAGVLAFSVVTPGVRLLRSRPS